MKKPFCPCFFFDLSFSTCRLIGNHVKIGCVAKRKQDRFLSERTSNKKLTSYAKCTRLGPKMLPFRRLIADNQCKGHLHPLTVQHFTLRKKKEPHKRNSTFKYYVCLFLYQLLVTGNYY
jgi:hypothetical protein